MAGRNRLKGKKVRQSLCQNETVGRGPNYTYIRSAATHENMYLKVMELPEHGIVVFDKGYNRYSSFKKWDSSNRYFVTRNKDNSRYIVVRDFDCSRTKDIITDELISLNYREKGVCRTVEARLFGYIDLESGERLKFITNLMEHNALTVALLCKNRWVIEVHFKQNFELKYFFFGQRQRDQNPDMGGTDTQSADYRSS